MEKQLTEKYDKLPQDIKDAIFSAGVEKALTGIGERYGLHIDKIGELMEAVELVMLGVTQPKDFIRNLYDRLETEDKEQVRRIAHEVNEQVFQKIRESLKTVHRATDEAQEPASEERRIPMEKIPETKMVGTAEPVGQNQGNIVAEKLQKMNVMPKTESTYEIKTDERDKKKLYADPYREPI